MKSQTITSIRLFGPGRKHQKHNFKTIRFFIAIISFLASAQAFAQDWARVKNLPETEFSALEVIDGTIFTAASGQLYYSHDNFASWQTATITTLPVIVTCFKKFGNILYAGTMADGIFSIPYNQLQATWTHNIGTLAVSSFLEKNNVLYVSTMGYGNYRLAENGQFGAFSNNLPSYSHSVNKLLPTPTGIMAIAGANGTFYNYDFGHNRWEENYYASTYDPGLDLDDAVRIGNTIYVSRRNRLLRTDDFGQTWITDQTGLQNGHNRFMHTGQNSVYTLTTIFTGDTNVTFLRKRNLAAPSQSTWDVGSEVLPFYVYALRESGQMMYAAAVNGLYFKIDTTLRNQIADAQKNHIAIYPNPSKDGIFTLKSSRQVDAVGIYDLSGKSIGNIGNVSETCNFEVPAQGIYLVKAISGTDVQTFKIISEK